MRSAARPTSAAEHKTNDVANSTADISVTGPPPQLVVHASAGDNGVALSIANHDCDVVKIVSTLHLQRWQANRWSALHSFTVGYDCADKPAECIELTPGAELLPPGIANGRCGCTLCSVLSPGNYRILVQSCDQKRVLSSAPFSPHR